MSGPTPPYEWQQPSFQAPEPPEPSAKPNKWYRNPLIVVPTAAVTAVLWFSFNGPRSQEDSPSPAFPTPSATSEKPSASASASPTATVTITAKPTETPRPVPPSGFPGVSTLEGNVGFYAPDEDDASEGVLWGRAVTRRNTVNFIPITCKDGIVTAQLSVVDKDNEVIKRYKADEYPKIFPKPCDGNEIQASVRETPFEYYSVLLGRIIAKGTVGR